MSVSSEISISSSAGRYEVHIGSGLLDELLEQSDQKWVIDQSLTTLYPRLARTDHVPVLAVEEAKTLDTVAALIEGLRDRGANRQTHLVAVGGGIVQDVATFTASAYMRGIDWTYCPTTLLGMVDSCIGGKSSINVGRYKNIAGNFHPPRQVLIDTDFCRTLPTTQVVEGLCEAVKICFAGPDAAFTEYQRLMAGRSPETVAEILAPLIRLSLETKKTFIEEDEFDQGIRLLLNFGHTFGHAIEGASHYQISHGIAVGLGMLAALNFSSIQGQAVPTMERVRALSVHVRALLRHVPGLPERLRDLSASDAMERFRSDKKHTQREYALILLNGQGRLERRMLPKTGETESALSRTFENLRKELDEIQ